MPLPRRCRQGCVHVALLGNTHSTLYRSGLVELHTVSLRARDCAVFACFTYTAHFIDGQQFGQHVILHEMSISEARHMQRLRTRLHVFGVFTSLMMCSTSSFLIKTLLTENKATRET